MNVNLAAAAFSVMAMTLGTASHALAQSAEYSLVVTDAGGDTIDLLLTTPGFNYATIIGISGTFDATTVTGLSLYAGADNLLFANQTPPWDFGGISFTTADGNTYNLGGETGYPLGQVNSFAADPGGQGGLPGDYNVISETLTQVPEPLSAALLVVGMTAVAASARRRKRG